MSRKVDPAATGGQSSVLPWEISVFLRMIRSRNPATGTDEGGEVSRGHIRHGEVRAEGPNLEAKEQSETIR